jgi:hypothetical protein
VSEKFRNHAKPPESLVGRAVGLQRDLAQRVVLVVERELARAAGAVAVPAVRIVQRVVARSRVDRVVGSL